MQKNVKRSSKVIAIALIMALMTTIAYAVIKYQEKITNTATIMGYEVKLWRTDTNAIVTSITWGSIDQGANKTSDEAFGFTKKLTFKNVGDKKLWVAWKLNSTLPAGVTITAYMALGEGSSWLTSTWDQNVFSFVDPMDANVVGNNRIMWNLTIANGAPRGPITFDILLLAADTASGQANDNAKTP